MINTLVQTALLGVVAWLLLVALLVIQERRLIYYPTRALVADPADYDLEAEELDIATPDGERLHGWWIRGPSDRVIIWYHGNAGNISHRLPNARWFVDQFETNVVLVDYRGYGRSSGSPDEPGLYADGLAVYDGVLARGTDPLNIVLFGRSLGAAVAIEVATRRGAGGLVLESAFRSIREVAREHYWFVPTALARTRMDNESKIGQITIPTLLLHGSVDRIIPAAHSRRLADAAGNLSAFHPIVGAGHNNTWLAGGNDYARAWADFLDETAGPPDGAPPESNAATAAATP